MCCKRKIVLLILLLYVLWVPVCSASEVYTITREQMQQINAQLNEHEKRMLQLLKGLNESEEDLMIALKALDASKKESEKLKIELKAAKEELKTAEQLQKKTSEELRSAERYCEQLKKRAKQNNEITAGVAYIYDRPYGMIGYRNRNIKYTALYSPRKNSVGFAVEFSICEW